MNSSYQWAVKMEHGNGIKYRLLSDLTEQTKKQNINIKHESQRQTKWVYVSESDKVQNYFVRQCLSIIRRILYT